MQERILKSYNLRDSGNDFFKIKLMQIFEVSFMSHRTADIYKLFFEIFTMYEGKKGDILSLYLTKLGLRFHIKL